VQQVVLKDTLDLSGKTGNSAGNDASKGAAPHVAMRIDTEESQNSTNSETASTTAEPATSGSGPATNGGNSTVSGKSSREPPPEPKRDRIIELLGGKLTLNVADEPLIGSINAPHVVVEMLSYDCSHCRKTNKMVKKAMSRYGDQVALVVLPLPLEAKCNRLVINPAASHTGACTTARTTIALAKVKPASFPRFHDYLMSGDEKKPPSLASILTKAFGLADRVKLQTVRDSKEMDKTIASYVDLFESLQKQSKKSKEEFGLPIQILGDHIMSGSVEKAEDIYKAWEEHLGVKPR
jgi:hypothetical protein